MRCWVESPESTDSQTRDLTQDHKLLPVERAQKRLGMQKIGFEEAIGEIRRRDGRYDPDAYAFLKDALDYSVRIKREKEGGEYPHVSGRELLFGVRDLALEEFGPMAATVLEIWGVTCSEDIGEMVFQLIEIGAFGKSEDDSLEDFGKVFSFREAFCDPFLPRDRHLPVGGSLVGEGSDAADAGEDGQSPFSGS